jgi:hypothetical protein
MKHRKETSHDVKIIFDSADLLAMIQSDEDSVKDYQ